MPSDFNEIIELRNCHSAKWDRMALTLQINAPDAIPMWIADMDFRTSSAVTRALLAEVKRGVHGYYDNDAAWKRVCQSWLARRHGWHIATDWVLVTPGVITGIAMVMQALGAPGDGVVLFPPVYHAFRGIIEANGRRIIDCPLVESQGRFAMDLDRLARELPDHARFVILCSPHNPGGRLWTAQEISALADLCLQRNLILISDEIHNDLVYSEGRHIVTALAAPQIADRLITCLGTSKSFNLAGAPAAAVITAHEEYRERIFAQIKAAGLATNNRFAMVASEAAWRDGDDWLAAVLAYLQANRDYFIPAIERAVPGARVMPLESTYLPWVDFRGVGLEESDLVRRIRDVARIGVSPGRQFGPGGEMHARFNIATPRRWIDEALSRLSDAFADLR